MEKLNLLQTGLSDQKPVRLLFYNPESGVRQLEYHQAAPSCSGPEENIFLNAELQFREGG